MRHSKLALFATSVGLLWAFPVHGLTTTITSKVPSAAVTNSTRIEFEFVASESDVRFYCSLDYADPEVCEPPKEYRGLADGNHHFKVFSRSENQVDSVGDVHMWRVDTVAPKTKLSATPNSMTSYTIDLLASEANSTFVCSFDGQPAAACSTPVQWNNISDGNHYFLAQAVDEAGNVDPVGADLSFVVNSEPPINTSITRIEPQAEFTNSTSILFDFVSNHLGAKFICSLAGASSACTAPFTYTNLPDGYYTFLVQATDSSGTDPVGASYSWTVDTVPPTGVVNVLDATSTSVTVEWTSNEPATTELVWGKDVDLSKVATPDMTFATTHKIKLTGLSSNTPYSIQPRGVDRAGNPYAMPAVQVRTKR